MTDSRARKSNRAFNEGVALNFQSRKNPQLTIITETTMIVSAGADTEWGVAGVRPCRIEGERD